jgi:protein tyrosine phosphatase (PTP) superfamily phosphohydrolase (DUF442 family)
MNITHKYSPGARFALVAAALLFTLHLAADDAPFPELPNFHQVNRGLFRGAAPKAGGLQRLASLGIKTVLDLMGAPTRDGDAAEDAQAAGLRYLNVALSSYRRPAMADVEKALAIINNPANQPVFVYCTRGGDRTGVVIAAYRVSHDGWSGEAALREAKLYALGFWQYSMKKFILEYPRNMTPIPAAPTKPAAIPAPARARAPASRRKPSPASEPSIVSLPDPPLAPQP